MDSSQISDIRLTNQQIASSKCKTAKDVVAWMGAMQAQDYYMVKWAIGQRISGSNEHDVDSAIDSGEILRTHLMRPTWHFVSPDDIHWLLKLTALKIKTSMKSRDRELELTEQVYSKCNSIIEKALAQEGHLTRDELVLLLQTSKIRTNENRASHIFMRAELERIICSGKLKNKKQTFALLSERAPNHKNLHRDEALAQLAQRYFTSHGPATLHDFAWWSGLSLRDVKHAIDMVQSCFVSETIQDKEYWFTSTDALAPTNNSVYVLPAFDEFLISYKDRSASLPQEINSKAVSNNGIFRPTIIANGKVVGIWQRTIKAGRVIIATEFLQPVSKVLKSKAKEAFTRYVDFIDKKAEFKKSE
jgi:hypothetical protein